MKRKKLFSFTSLYCLFYFSALFDIKYFNSHKGDKLLFAFKNKYVYFWLNSFT